MGASLRGGFDKLNHHSRSGVAQFPIGQPLPSSFTSFIPQSSGPSQPSAARLLHALAQEISENPVKLPTKNEKSQFL